MSGTDSAGAGRPDNRRLVIKSSHGAGEVMARVSALSTRGKLPGFVKRGERAFEATVFGEPYDRVLVAGVRDSGDGGSVIEGEVRLKRKMPTIMIVVFLFTIWPGVWLTDSLMVTYFSWYPRKMWVTVAWYVPLCLLALPALWKQWKKSCVIAAGELVTVEERLRGVVG
ncbi:MAG: hypothetical protein KDA30_11735 [Phycisphaerales bacterium]|nr:hypothetical protein [Phycisphaerales bacterium]